MMRIPGSQYTTRRRRQIIEGVGKMIHLIILPPKTATAINPNIPYNIFRLLSLRTCIYNSGNKNTNIQSIKFSCIIHQTWLFTSTALTRPGITVPSNSPKCPETTCPAFLGSKKTRYVPAEIYPGLCKLY
jgi:hypothetical protein